MTAEEFTVQIMDMKKTLYHVSCGILRSEADREDAVQECICKAWEKRNSLKSEGAFPRMGDAHSYQRMLRHLPPGEQDRSSRRDAGGGRPRERRPRARDAVMGLDEIYRMPILLFYVEGFSIREISRILQIPEGTVKSRLFAGRGKLREVLGEEVPV